MLRRPCLWPRFGAFLLVLGISAAAYASPPVLISAVSRIQHGTAGNFDIPLPLTGGTGIECRDLTNGVWIVLTFDQPLTSGKGKVTVGVGNTAGFPQINGNTIKYKLMNVTDAQAVNLNAYDVMNAAGEKVTVDVPFRVLLGDVNANGSVTGADVNIVKDAVGSALPVNAGNFRSDYNVNGALTGADVNMLKVAAGNAGFVDGGATANTPPTVSSLPNMQAVTGLTATPAGFTIGDGESDPASLYVSAKSSDQTTIPDANIAIGGSGASRSISITPAAGVATEVPVTITILVSDGLTTSSPGSFVVTVVPPPTTYLATLAPMTSQVKSLGAGYATIQLSGDKKSASLRYTYSNLAGADTDDAIYAPGDDVLYDVPVGLARGDQQPDGSFKWVFGSKAASIAATIQNNQAYIIIETVAYPAGELKGVFKKVNGSSVFVPPGNPPPLAINPPSKYDASRFLQQAAFGGKRAEIAALSSPAAANATTALDDWLEAQFNMPGPIYPNYANAAVRPATQPAVAPATQPVLAPLGPQSTTQPYTASSMYYQIWGRTCVVQPPSIYADSLTNDRVHEAWWKNAVTAPDQLRQRVATAYSELFVVSEIEGTVNNNILGLASYYDMLANDAFANFRTILRDVTLHPIMGQYLNMRGNNKATPPQVPNENYAREILQLFSIGLYQLHPDGTLVLDQNGQPIPTYDQATITNFAQVFTGWNVASPAVVIPTIPPTTQPAVVVNVNNSYQKPMVVTASNHAQVQKTLLNYPGAARYVPTTQPGVIPATTSTNATICDNELNFALDNIFNHPNVGPFICKQLIQRLVCSNPSPGYVYRCTKVFNDDGTGTRGNMKAVIKAILTDYEARNTAQTGAPGYGRMREPIIRVASLLRSLGGYSKSGKWVMGKTDTTLQQTIFRSPTVFNFFDPHYAEPGPLTDAGDVSPELGIILATTITSGQNMLYTGIYSSNTGTGFRGDGGGSDIYLDHTSSGSGLQTLAQTSGPSAMIDETAMLLMGAPLDSAMKTIITNFTLKLSATDYQGKTRAAIHLISTSPQAVTQK